VSTDSTILQNKTIFASVKSAYGAFSRPLKVRFWISLALLFVNSVVELAGLAALLPLFSIMLKDNFVAQSRVLSSLYSSLRFQTPEMFAVFLCGVILAIMLLKNALSVIIQRYQTRYSFSLYTYFSTSLLRHYYSLGYINFKRHNSNFLVSYISNYPSWFAQFLILPLLTFLNELVVIILIVAGIIAYTPMVVILLMTTVFPLSALVYIYVRKRINGLGLVRAEVGAHLNKSIHQAIEGYVDVKTLDKERFVFSQYRKLVEKNSALSTRSNVLLTIPSKVLETGMVMGIIALIISGLFISSNKADLSLLIGMFAIAAYRILPSINRMTAALLSVREHLFTVDMITNIKTAGETFKQPGPKVELRFENKVTVENLSYSYTPDRKILDGINFEIRKGETIGIIGRSGSGKTTLLNVLLRFLTEDSGRITVDGVPLDSSNQSGWLNLIGYVQQHVYIVDGTIAENIAFGVPANEVDHELLKRVIETASLSEYVASLSNGIHTPLGERGALLSGGQRQRIGIARSLYSKASVLLFDEATSALDQETEAEVTESIRTLAAKNYTNIIIAHRYTTLRYCDRILELEDGRIKGIHSYPDLVQKMV
jgi:ATP-binding cassette, subfamily B, bacterial PglK